MSDFMSTKRKYIILAAGAFAIFFTGFPHIWSVYQPYAMTAAGWSQGQASMCFYIYFVTFVFGNILGGRIQDQYSPRRAVLWGGGIFTASILLSSAALRPSPVMMYVTYGVLQGFGQGMIYTTIISTAQKWFPDRTGFASGVIVTANGLCGFFMAPVSRSLLEQRGISWTFLAVGTVIGVSWVLASLVIANPPVAEGKEGHCWGKQYSAQEMIRTRKFYFLLLTMLFGLVPYLLVSPFSQTIQMDRGIAGSVAVASVMIGSVCNAATRLALPTIADRVGRIACVKAVLVMAGAAMIVLAAAPASLTPGAVVLVYGCYGGIMGSFPSLCSELFGMTHSGENYGFVMFGIVIATLASPAITKAVMGMGLPVEAVFAAGGLSAVAALVCAVMLGRVLREEQTVVPDSPSSDKGAVTEIGY